MNNYRSEPPSNRWPFEFESWPREQQINVVERRMTRQGIIRESLSMAGLDPEDYNLRDDTKLRKKELAAIYLAIQGINYDDS